VWSARWRLASLWAAQAALAAALALGLLTLAALLTQVRPHPLALVLFLLLVALAAPAASLPGLALPLRVRLVLVAALLLALPAAAAGVGSISLFACGLFFLVAAFSSTSALLVRPAAEATGLAPVTLLGIGAALLGAALAVVVYASSDRALVSADLFLQGSGVELALVLDDRLYLVIALLCLAAALAALPVRFGGERPAGQAEQLDPWTALRRDAGRVLRDREALGALLGLAVLRATFFALLVRELLHPLTMIWSGAGYAVGCVLGGLNGHPERSLGRVPLGLTGLVLVLGLGALAGSVSWLWLGLLAGAVLVPLQGLYLAAVPADALDAAVGLAQALTAALTAVWVALLASTATAAFLVVPAHLFTVAAGLALLGAAVAWRAFWVPTLELLAEWLITPLYRMSAAGPGKIKLPRRGPLLLVANHAAWGDPFFVAWAAPRHVRPMMTSRFYDLPVIRWLMRHVVGAIRVEQSLVRRERPPELDEAVAALRKGECVAVFPEGGMRKDERTLLRPFGQGVWHILCTLPQTPVTVCWIENSWGSYTSYFNGPPTKNKRLDIRRPIRLALTEPEVLPAEILADRQRTRAYLRRRCLECRAYLGLEVPPEEPPQALQPDAPGASEEGLHETDT
jgi:1-acyl-sn-glycerol-3-phosphate acyltransferase